MASVEMFPTTVLYSGKQFFAAPKNVANDISKWQAENAAANADEENVPGGVITDHDSFLEKMLLMMPSGSKMEWRDASADSVTVGEVEGEGLVVDQDAADKLKTYDPNDIATILLSAVVREMQSISTRRSAVGNILDAFSNLIRNYQSVVPRGSPVSLELMTADMRALADRLRVSDAVTTLRSRKGNLTEISPFHAPIYFSEHDGLSLYYDADKNYVLEIVGKVMVVSQLGYLVHVDEGFDDECEKVKFRVARFDKNTARAVISLSKVMRGRSSGTSYIFHCEDTFQVGYHSYPGFKEYSIRIARGWRDRLLSIINSAGGNTMPLDKNWHQWSRSHFAFALFFKDKLSSDMSIIGAIDKFIDDICLYDASTYSEQVRELVEARQEIDKDVFSFVTSTSACHGYVDKTYKILQKWGATPKALQQNRLNRDTVLDFKYPTFKENDDRLEAGRKSRFGDPGATLNKQYPVFPGGPAVVLGEATSDKIVSILATLSSLAGPGVLSQARNLLYSGVTNFDRMLEIICGEWIKAHGDDKGVLSRITLLDKAQPSPPKWSLKYLDHVFSLRDLKNPSGQFVCEDLIDHLNSMDVTGGRKDVIISDANVLGTDSNTYLTKNEFAVSKVSLGSEALDKWINERAQKWTGQATATAKYILKTVSKFKAGVLKLHIFDLSIDFFSVIGQKLMEVFNCDSFLWKNGRGHNVEFFFYFFPKVVDRKFSMFRAATFYLPALLSMCAVSEITRHVAYYAPHRQVGKVRFTENGVLDEDPNFPTLVANFHSRSPHVQEVGGWRFNGIKGLRSGLKSLVGGIQISQPEIADVSEFESVEPKDPPKEPEPPKTLVAAEGKKNVIVPIKKGESSGVSGEICTVPKATVVSAKTSPETSFLPVPSTSRPETNVKEERKKKAYE